MSIPLVSPVFIGRVEELGALLAALQRARAGESGFAVIGGEAGVGKTRLLEEFGQRASAAAVRVLSGQCVELGVEGLSFAPLVDALRTLVRSTAQPELNRLLGPARRELSRLLPDLDPDPAEQPVGTVTAPSVLLELVLGVVQRLAAAQPLLLIIEDLHWADQSTLDLVAYLVRALRDACVLIVVTYRSDEIHRRHLLRPLLTSWERVRAVHRFELLRFGRSEVAAQLEAIQGATVTPGLVDLVFERSEGNAFLVEEILSLAQSGGDAMSLPPSLRDVLLARVDRLSEPARHVLQLAAVAGRSVPHRLLLAVAQNDEGRLLEAVRESVENQVLVVDEAAPGYTFRHALGREAVYEDMLPGERGRIHAAYGHALSERPELGGDPMSSLAAQAHHWYVALDLPRALAASIAAAGQAAAAYAPAEAVRHLERALQIWPQVADAETITGLDTVEVLRLAAEACFHAGAIDRAMSLLNRALGELGTAPDNSVRRALLLDLQALCFHGLGREAQSTAALQGALAQLPENPPSTAFVSILASLATAHMRLGDMAEAADAASRVITSALEVSARAQEAEARITLGVAQTYLGRVGLGLGELRTGLALALESNVTEVALRGYINLSDVLEMLGRHEEAAVAAADGMALAGQVGLTRTFGAFLAGNLAEPWFRLGRWADADRVALDALSSQPEGVFAATLLEVRGQLAALSGRYDEAETLAAHARGLVADVTDAQFGPGLTFTQAKIAMARGDLGAAERLLATALSGAGEPVEALLARYTWPLVWLASLVASAQLQHSRDRRMPIPEPALAALATQLAASLSATTAPNRMYRALVAAEQGRIANRLDVGSWTAAVRAGRAAGEPYLLAYALLGLASDLLASSSRPEAVHALQEAAALAEDLGAKPLSADIDALARRGRVELAVPNSVGPPSQQHQPPADTDGLTRFGITAREREVLDLLTEGLTNSQIGSRLFISPKTVSVHVSNLLAKLGVSGRTEAASLTNRLNRAAPKN